MSLTDLDELFDRLDQGPPEGPGEDD
jgi:hypothetical protein